VVGSTQRVNQTGREKQRAGEKNWEQREGMFSSGRLIQANTNEKLKGGGAVPHKGCNNIENYKLHREGGKSQVRCYQLNFRDSER